MWNAREEQRLRELRLDPSRLTRERLASLVRHFKGHGTMYSVTTLGVPVDASHDLARKVRRLAQGGQLDWLEREAVRPEPRLNPPEGGALWTVGALKDDGFAAGEAAALVRLWRIASGPEGGAPGPLLVLLAIMRQAKRAFPAAPLGYVVALGLAELCAEAARGREDLGPAGVISQSFRELCGTYEPWRDRAASFAFWDELEVKAVSSGIEEPPALVGILRELALLRAPDEGGGDGGHGLQAFQLLAAVIGDPALGQAAGTAPFGGLAAVIEGGRAAHPLPPKLADLIERLLAHALARPCNQLERPAEITPPG